MKKHYTLRRVCTAIFFLFSFIVNLSAQNNERHLILCTTGYGFDRNAANGIADPQWTYIQKFANLSYNGQDASVTAVRFYVDWQQYEPTVGNYHGAKLATAVQTILNTRPGMKIALHFDYKRGGPMPDGIGGSDDYFGEEDIARTNTGALVQATIAYRCPSIYSQTARTRFANFVANAMSHLTAYSSSILYAEMGSSQAEEFAMPYLYNGVGGQGFYEDKAVSAWRTEYLPCRYPGQSTVTWGGNTYQISSAPTASNPYWDWNSDHQREYHRFAAWGLMRLYKEFRAAVRTYVPSTRIMYFISDFGSSQGNLFFMHNSTIPMAMQEFDGIYSSDGGQHDNWRKIMAVDVMRSMNPNKLAAIEFDQDDLGQPTPSNSSTPLNPNAAIEWIPRAYKHGANYVHLTMTFNDVQIEQLKPIFASVKATYLNSGYTPPARQAATTQNLFPNVFTGNQITSNWNSNGGDNWSVTDNNPVSLNLIDDGYWQNIWSCTAPAPCDFNMTASTATPNVAPNVSVTLNSACTGSTCSGLTYSWSGTGISGSNTNSSVTFNAPATAGTYTYTLTTSKSGCSNKTATVQVTVSASCDFNITASNAVSGSNLNLSYVCSGANCSGVSYSWSGNGASGSTSPLTITKPTAAGTYTYTVTASKAGCTSKTATTTYTVSGGGNPCGYIDKQTVGTWNGLNVQTRQYTVSGVATWFIVTAINGSTADKHFPRGQNFADRGDISWTNGVINKTCLGGGSTGYDGLVFPSGITVPSGYVQGTEPDGAVYFQQTTCTPPSAPTLSASPATINSGGSSTLSASGCSGGTITWSDGLGTGVSKPVSPTSTKTYSATCTIGSCVSAAGNVTVTVNPGGGPSCSNVQGFFDGANCDYLDGWAYDANSPNTVVNVDIYEGSTLIAGNIPAGNFRQDLVDAGKGNGYHGFSIPVPSPLKNGASHSLTIKVTGCSNFSLINSPRTIAGCSGGCSTPAAPTLTASPATITSGGSSTLSASGCSGGTITWSDGLGTGTSKSVSPTATKTYTATCSIGGCASSNGSVTVTVNSGTNCNNLSSDVNGANCHFIEGWAYNSNDPNGTVYIDIYDGANLLISNYAANKFRQDVFNAGMGNGNHAFEINTPAQLKDGQSHTLTFKVSGCNYTLTNSPKVLSGCSGNPVVIEMDEKKEFSIFPNPNNGSFNTSFYVARGKKATLVINDMRGRMLFRKEFTGAGQVIKERINLLDRSSGTLLIQLHQETGVETKKLNIVR